VEFLHNVLPRTLDGDSKETAVPLSGEAIRTMNYVDDISVTLRRILSTLPILTPEERQRVVEHIGQVEPSYESVVAALSAK
jgi:hypothetical protein